MADAAHPRDLIDAAPMRRAQIGVVALCTLLNALDGFDVLSISFAAPGIAAEWHIARAALGVVLAVELVGMSLGSFVLGALADRIGNRRVILAALVLMATGMVLAATAGDITTLAGWRLLTGLGIGGMLAATNAATAEVSSRRRRNVAVAIMAGGYPVGAVIGGTIASHLLATHDWRAVFLFGAAATAVCVPIVFAALPDSLEHLVQRRPPRALERANAVLRRFGQPTLAALPPVAPAFIRTGLPALFAKGQVAVTVALTLAYFAHMMTFYFTLKWIPKIVVDFGFPASAGGAVLVWANVGGVAGALALSGLARILPLRPLLIAFAVAASILVAAFGQVPHELGPLSLVAAAAGVCTNGLVVGLYAWMAASFPAQLRASGTGFVIGVGRGGAALGPVLAGGLFTAGWALPGVALCMAVGSLLAAATIALFGARGRTVEG